MAERFCAAGPVVYLSLKKGLVAVVRLAWVCCGPDEPGQMGMGGEM